MTPPWRDLPGPIRRLAWCTFFNRCGGGLLLVIVPVYFVRFQDVSITQLGLLLGLASLAAVAAPLPTGRLVERHGSMHLLRIVLALLAVASLGPIFARGPVVVLPTWSLVVALDAALSTANQVVIAEYSGRGAAVVSKGFLRSVSSVAISLGAGAGGVVLLASQAGWFHTALAANAVLTAAAFAISLALPRPVADRSADPTNHRARDVFRDRWYVAMVIVSSVSTIHFVAVETALALFVVTATDLPAWSAGAFLVANTVLVAVWQTGIAARITELRSAPRAMITGAVAVLAAFVLVASSARTGTPAGLVLLALAAVAYSLGEMTLSAGEWTLTFDTVPEGRHGSYQSLVVTLQTVADTLFRFFVVALCLAFGGLGWVVVGLITLAAALTTAPLLRQRGVDPPNLPPPEAVELAPSPCVCTIRGKAAPHHEGHSSRGFRLRRHEPRHASPRPRTRRHVHRPSATDTARTHPLRRARHRERARGPALPPAA